MSKKNLSIGGVLVLILVCAFLSVSFVSKASASEQSSFEGLIDRIYRAYVVNWPTEYQVNGTVDVNNLPPTYNPQVITFFEDEPFVPGAISPVFETDGYEKMFIYALDQEWADNYYFVEVSLDGGDTWINSYTLRTSQGYLFEREISAPLYRIESYSGNENSIMNVYGYLR